MTTAVLDLLLVSTAPVGRAPHLVDDPANHPVNQRIDLLPALGLYVDQVSQELSEAVLKECEPYGWAKVHRQWGSTWGFFRSDAPTPQLGRPYNWDPDQAIRTALALSRLVRETEIGTEYAARVIEEQGHREIHPGPVAGHSAHASVHASVELRWLTVDDARQLAQLCGAYWPLRGQLPPRVQRALWHHEYAALTTDPNVRFIIVSTALEALVHTDPFKSTRQFGRVAQLATDVGVTGFAERDSRDAYRMRSEVAHGGRLASLTGTFPIDRIEEVFRALEAILRAAVKKAIEDQAFRGIFQSDVAIRSRWPI